MLQHVFSVLELGSMYVLFSLGLSIAWGTMKILNLAHGATFMFSAYAAHELTQRWSVGVYVLIPFAMVVGGLISVAIDRIAFRPLQRRIHEVGKLETAMMIASIGAAQALVGYAGKETGNLPFTLPPSVLKVHIYHLGGTIVSNLQILIIVVGVVLTVGLGLWLQRSRQGTAIRALACDGPTSELMGVNVSWLGSMTMFISGALAGTAGLLLTLYFGALDSSGGDNLLLKAFAALVVGGVGSVWGAMVGAFGLAVAEIVLTVNTNGTYTDAVSFSLIIVFLLLWPQGLFGRARVDRV